jgi:hypothetical protein
MPKARKGKKIVQSGEEKILQGVLAKCLKNTYSAIECCR